MTKAPFKTNDALPGDAFRVFGVTRKNNLDEKALDENYCKCTWAFDSIDEMKNLMKAMGVKPSHYEIFIPKGEGLLVAVSRDEDTVFALAPRTGIMEKFDLEKVS